MSIPSHRAECALKVILPSTMTWIPEFNWLQLLIKLGAYVFPSRLDKGKRTLRSPEMVVGSGEGIPGALQSSAPVIPQRRKTTCTLASLWPPSFRGTRLLTETQLIGYRVIAHDRYLEPSLRR